jgi:hypothetical protein
MKGTKQHYTKDNFPALPKGVWWEADRQRFRVRLYSQNKVFRAPYTSIRSAGSIKAAYDEAMEAYNTVRDEVAAHNAKYQDTPDISNPSGLLRAIGRSATSIKVNTRKK